jgi:ABC-2 type transport system permease protein
MRKYWHVINIGIQNNLTYRVNYLVRCVFGFLPLIAIIFLWRAIYADQGGGAIIGTFTFTQMVSYYLLAAIVDALTAVNEDDWQIAADIKDGNISQFLLKPIDYLWLRLCLFCSGRVTYISVTAIPLAIFIWCWHSYFILPPDGATFVIFMLSVGLTALIQFFTSFAMAMLAFWVLEVSTFIFILYALEYLASGHLFPLDVLPPAVARALYFTPFPYQLYFPISIYMGKIHGTELVRGLAAQSCWVVVTYGIARLAWARGLRKYAAAGG